MKPPLTIRPCRQIDFETIHAIINDAAEAYRCVIPEDCWKVPYMSREELRHEIAEGVVFWGGEEGSEIVGVMGLQDVMDVTLIRHAYVRAARRNQGLGGRLLAELLAVTTRPTLVGTWAAAEWAIRFYQRHGFRLVTPEAKDRLLRKYWSIPDRQIETSEVLADERWWARYGEAGDPEVAPAQDPAGGDAGPAPAAGDLRVVLCRRHGRRPVGQRAGPGRAHRGAAPALLRVSSGRRLAPCCCICG